MTNLAPYHTFLATPNNDTLDAFVDSRAAIFVDWHEGDTDILDYLNDRLPDGAKIDYEETGDAIALIKTARASQSRIKEKGATAIPPCSPRNAIWAQRGKSASLWKRWAAIRWAFACCTAMIGRNWRRNTAKTCWRFGLSRLKHAQAACLSWILMGQRAS